MAVRSVVRISGPSKIKMSEVSGGEAVTIQRELGRTVIKTTGVGGK